jgi:TolB-like protein
MGMMKYRRFIFLLIALCSAAARSQISAALGDFENQTDRLYLDSWSRKIPEFISTDLSRFADVAVVDRQRLKAVLDEQKLQATGLTDSSRILEIGRLLSAEYVVSGVVSETGGWIRIDARITSVISGRMVSEVVMCRSDRYLEKMVSVLANNIRLRITGKGDYRESLILRKYPTKYFLGGSLLAGAVASVIHGGYLVRRNEYRKAERLDDFGPKYASANRWNRTQTVALSLTAAAVAATLICWINDLSPDRIQANPGSVRPALGILAGEVTLGLRINL